MQNTKQGEIFFSPLPLSFTVSVQYGTDVRCKPAKVVCKGKTKHGCSSNFMDRKFKLNDDNDYCNAKNLRASRTGKRLSRAVSLGSLNQDLIGIALSEHLQIR